MSPQSIKEEEQMSHVPYDKIIGSIMYVLICICPNLSHVVSTYIEHPKNMYFQIVK